MICATALTLGLLAAPAFAQEAEAAPDPLIAAPGLCEGDDDPAAHHRTQRLAMLCLVRGMRRRAGLQSLRESDTLRRSATYKARRIAACRTFTHNPCGDRFDTPFRKARLARNGRWLVGEDLAWGVAEDATPRAIIAKWLRSESHRQVLLTADFTHLGVRRRRLLMQDAPRGAVLWVLHVGRAATP